jgi:hypothetical protein
MNKIRKKKSPDSLPESHPAFATVGPEHLAFAFHCEWGAQTARMPGLNPSEEEINLDMGNGEIQRVSFSDTQSNRVTSTVLSELRSFFPESDPNSFLRSLAVMMRLNAMAKILQIPEIARLIREDPDGNFFLPGFVTTTCATAPLAGKYADFERSSFLTILREAQESNSGVGVELRLPKEMIGGIAEKKSA